MDTKVVLDVCELCASCKQAIVSKTLAIKRTTKINGKIHTFYYHDIDVCIERAFVHCLARRHRRSKTKKHRVIDRYADNRILKKLMKKM